MSSTICLEYFNARNRFRAILAPDHLMVVKADSAVGLVLAGGGLADVMQQRRPTQNQIGPFIFQGDCLVQHRQRMLVDVFVLMVLVDRHPHSADLGQHHFAHPGLHHQVDPGDRVVAQQQLVQFGRHPLGGDPAELRRHLLDRRPHPRSDREAELRDEPRGAQHPQRIVTEGVRRSGRGIEHAGTQRRQTA